MTARQANDALNEYISDRRRGFVVLHDHFTGKPHGGLAMDLTAEGNAGRTLSERREEEGDDERFWWLRRD